MPNPIKSESLGLENRLLHFLKLIQISQLIKEEGTQIRECEEGKKGGRKKVLFSCFQLRGRQKRKEFIRLAFLVVQSEL